MIPPSAVCVCVKVATTRSLLTEREEDAMEAHKRIAAAQDLLATVSEKTVRTGVG